MRRLFYFFKNIILLLSHRGIKVSLSCRIKARRHNLGGADRFSPRAYFDGTMGRYCVIGPDSRIVANLGNYVSIGPNVKTVSAVHPVSAYSTSDYVYKSLPEILPEGFSDDLGPVNIGHDVWIGENVLIKGGLSIGNGAVIGMGSVVTRDVPPYSIVAGVPAKVIRYRFDRDTIERLEKSRWWLKEPNDLSLGSFDVGEC